MTAQTASTQISIHPITTLEGFARCVELQGAVWGYDIADLVPRKLFLLAERIGGQVIGGFVGPESIDSPSPSPAHMVGFAMALPAYRDGVAYLHSHMLAVLPEYRNLGLGQRLKLAQRDDALVRGITRMEWTFDPLEIRNAHLNITRFGAICRRYEPNFYGPSSSPLQGGLPTDRLYAEWWMHSPHTEAVLAGQREAFEVLERIVVPAEVLTWKANPTMRSQAEQLQSANRSAFQSAFARGLCVRGFEVDPQGNGTYLLSTPPSHD